MFNGLNGIKSIICLQIQVYYIMTSITFEVNLDLILKCSYICLVILEFLHHDFDNI
jgi:hypothetical protein